MRKCFTGGWVRDVMHTDGIIKQWLLKSTYSLQCCLGHDHMMILPLSLFLCPARHPPYRFCVLWPPNTWSITVMHSCHDISHQVATRKRGQVTNCWQQILERPCCLPTRRHFCAIDFLGFSMDLFVYLQTASLEAVGSGFVKD